MPWNCLSVRVGQLSNFEADSRVLIVASLLPFLTAIGCSEGQRYKLTAVEGYVNVDGKPVSNVMVQFLPDKKSGKKCPTSSGVTDEFGHFELTTTDGRPGAVIGMCMVTLVELNEAERGRVDPADPSTIPKSVKKRVPSRYTIPSPQGLTVDVKENGEPVTIDAKSK
jgi:hypothetical protein